jgi:hypothetical protein
VTLWSIPLALAALTGLLSLATHLEETRVRVLVRMTIRSNAASPEIAEQLVAVECARVLAAHGLTDQRASLP